MTYHPAPMQFVKMNSDRRPLSSKLSLVSQACNDMDLVSHPADRSTSSLYDGFPFLTPHTPAAQRRIEVDARICFRAQYCRCADCESIIHSSCTPSLALMGDAAVGGASRRLPALGHDMGHEHLRLSDARRCCARWLLTRQRLALAPSWSNGHGSGSACHYHAGWRAPAPLDGALAAATGDGAACATLDDVATTRNRVPPAFAIRPSNTPL